MLFPKRQSSHQDLGRWRLPTAEQPAPDSLIRHSRTRCLPSSSLHAGLAERSSIYPERASCLFPAQDASLTRQKAFPFSQPHLPPVFRQEHLNFPAKTATWHPKAKLRSPYTTWPCSALPNTAVPPRCESSSRAFPMRTPPEAPQGRALSSACTVQCLPDAVMYSNIP